MSEFSRVPEYSQESHDSQESQESQENTVSIIIKNNKILIENGNINIKNIKIYKKNIFTEILIFNEYKNEYIFDEDGVYKIKILGNYKHINGIIKKYKYNGLFTINDICYICYNSGCDSFHIQHSGARFHINCMNRCSSCPICRGTLQSHFTEYTDNIRDNDIVLSKLYLKGYENNYIFYTNLNQNKKIIFNNFMKIKKYKITTNENIIRVYASRESISTTQNIEKDKIEIFDISNGYIPIELPYGYTYKSSRLLLNSIDNIIDPSDIFLRDIKYIEDDSHIEYMNPLIILSSLTDCYNSLNIWIEIIFENENNFDISTFILLSNDLSRPGLVVKTLHPSNPYKSVVLLSDFPKPYWTNNIYIPILSNNIDNYVRFMI